jgi:hypothetical protein
MTIFLAGLIGDVAAHDGAGGLVLIVWGHNGENLIRAEGATRDEAWGRAVEQARTLRTWIFSTRIHFAASEGLVPA